MRPTRPSRTLSSPRLVPVARCACSRLRRPICSSTSMGICRPAQMSTLSILRGCTTPARVTAPDLTGRYTVVQVAGMGGVPADATTAVLNVTALNASAPGYMTVFPCGTAPPDAYELELSGRCHHRERCCRQAGCCGQGVCLHVRVCGAACRCRRLHRWRPRLLRHDPASAVRLPPKRRGACSRHCHRN